MKRILSLLLALGLASAAAHAQSTMPAMGTSTPKGQVAKTDASINQAPADTSVANRKSMKASKTRTRKTKTTKSTGAM